MRADEANAHNTKFILNCHNQAVMIAFDIENGPIVSNDTDITVHILDIRW